MVPLLTRLLDKIGLISITLGDSSQVQIMGIGTIPIFQSVVDMRYISHVLYIPELSFNVLSVSSLTHQGVEVLFLTSTITIQDLTTWIVLASDVCDGGLYKLVALFSHNCCSSSSAALWHAQFGHESYFFF